MGDWRMLGLVAGAIFLGLIQAAQAGEGAIRIGSKRFTESYILGEILRQTVVRSGEASAEHRAGLGNTGIVFAAYTSQLLLVAAAVGQPLDPAAAWGALGLAIIAGVVSLLPFGLGSADLVLVALLGVAGMPAAEATAVAFGYRVVSTLPLSLLGVGAYALLSAGMPDGQAGGAARLASEGLRADPPEPPA